MTGTIRKNKRDIPDYLKQDPKREGHSSLFLFYKKLMLVSYVSKKNKSVFPLTSSCLNPTIENTKVRKPEAILHYNRYKGGVDTVDRIIAIMSVKRSTNR